jgi:hypothetical protein
MSPAGAILRVGVERSATWTATTPGNDCQRIHKSFRLSRSKRRRLIGRAEVPRGQVGERRECVATDCRYPAL